MAQQSKTTTHGARRDVHAEITKTLIAQIEQGTLPWRKPWQAGQVIRPDRSPGPCGTM
ncbi:ArdC-like ssDNA-binding domain-containing protein [Marinivivus vitaminiproducens]|uniref:ArdC-like ssDNA-binding domain-containing protein n=1 Tax=Marinivivus vitaminiproducens TaxID=3035935 RepID=UPI003F9EF422